MFKALAAGEYVGTRGVTAWYRLTRDHRGSGAQRILGLVGRVFQTQRCVKMSEISSHFELWESRIREYEKLVFQTEKIQTKVPDSCKVFIVRSLVPKDLEKDLLKIHPTANYKTTEEYILEQASLERDAHFDDKGKHDKPVPMEVDALLAKVTALKEAGGVCRTEEAHGKQYRHPSSSCSKTNHLDWDNRTVLVPSVRPIRRRRSLWRLLMIFRRYPVRLSVKRKW